MSKMSVTEKEEPENMSNQAVAAPRLTRAPGEEAPEDMLNQAVADPRLTCAGARAAAAELQA